MGQLLPVRHHVSGRKEEVSLLIIIIPGIVCKAITHGSFP